MGLRTLLPIANGKFLIEDMEGRGAAEAGPKILRKVRATSYMLPDGHYWEFVHMNRCREGDRESGWNRFITAAKPRTVNELLLLTRGLKTMTGCHEGCGIKKDDSMGRLFSDTQTTGSYKPSESDMTDVESSLVTMVCPESSAPSWPESDYKGRMSEGERKMYRGFRMDNSSDSTYVPPAGTRKVVNVDVPMTLEGGRTTERDRLGDSKWNVGDEEDLSQPVSGTQGTTQLPSSVAYPITNSQSIEMLKELEKMGTAEEVAAVVDHNDNMDVVKGDNNETGSTGMLYELTTRMMRAEKLIMEMRDEIDKGKDFGADIVANRCPKCRENQNEETRGDGNTVKNAVKRRGEPPIVLVGMRPKTNGANGNDRRVAMPIDKPAYEVGIEKKVWSKVANNNDQGGTFNLVSRKKRTPARLDPITIIVERKGG